MIRRSACTGPFFSVEYKLIREQVSRQKKKEVDQEEEEEEDVPQPPETLPEAEAPVSGFLPLCVNTTLMIA